jgi:hypothetical protein
MTQGVRRPRPRRTFPRESSELGNVGRRAALSAMEVVLDLDNLVFIAPG